MRMQPLTENKIADLQQFLNDKLNERIQLISDGEGRRLFYNPLTHAFEISENGITVQAFHGSLHNAVRIFEGTLDPRGEAIKKLKHVLDTFAAPAHRRQHRDSSPDVKVLVENDIKEWYVLLESLA